MGKTPRACSSERGWSQGDPNLSGASMLGGRCFSTSGVEENPRQRLQGNKGKKMKTTEDTEARNI